MSIRNDSNGVALLNLSTTVTCDFLKTITNFILLGKVNEDDKDYKEVIVKGVADTCKASKGVFGNFVIQMIAENIHKYSNYSFDCQVKKDSYYVLNFPLAFDYVPHYLIGRTRSFSLTATVKGKVAKIKSLVHAFTLKFSGTIVV